MAHGHSTSGLVGKLVTELDVNYNADKYYQIFKNHEEVSRAIPHIYRSMKVLEGHGKTSGCIKEWCYIHEGKTLILKESTTYDDETRMICHTVIGGDIANDYKMFNATLLVKGNFGSQVIAFAPPPQPAPIRHSSLCRLAHKSHVSLSKMAEKSHLSFGKRDHKHHFSLKPILHNLAGCDCDARMQDFSPRVPTYAAPSFHGNTVMWIIDYEKMNKDSPVPVSYLAFFHRIILDLHYHFCAYG
ncbi:hypothetical protein MKW92_009122 [Papaver armeniacum]|nr:hypothetical protein MKW92_009122 [Papaver armeniacum]